MPLINHKITAFLKKVVDLTDTPSENMSPADIKAWFDSSPEELRVKINAIVDDLTSTATGNSGANNIGVETISGLTGNDVQTLLSALKTITDNKTDKTGNHAGTWQGVNLGEASEPINGGRIDVLTSVVADIAINIKALGVKGDGTDETSAIQSAIGSLSSSSVLLIPEGTYLISNALTFTNFKKIKIIGNGVIKLKPNSVNEVQLLKFLNCESIEVDGIVLDGDSSNQVNSHHGISVMGVCSQVYIHGVTIKNINSIGFSVGDGIYVASNCNFKIIGNHFLNIGRNGVSVVDGGNGNIIGNTFVDNKYLGVDVESNTGANAFSCVISSNIIRGGGGGINVKGSSGNGQSKNIVITSNIIDTLLTGIREGIAISDAKDCIVSDNVIDAGYQIGILVEATKTPVYASTVTENILVKDNVLTHRYNGSTASFYPVWVRSFHDVNFIKHVKFEGNTVRASGHTANIYGVVVTKGQFVSIVNNSISDNAGIGLFIQDSKNIDICDNKVLNNGRLGITTQGIRVNTSDVVTILNNVSTDTQDVKTQTYGLHLAGNTNVIVKGNYLKGNATAEKFYDKPIDFDNAFNSKVNHLNAPPTSGDYVVGDRVINGLPVETGTAGAKYVINGWVCVTSGTPGTWVPMRTLTGN